MYILDRTEENIAVIYDGDDNKIEVEINTISGNIRDGVVLLKTEDGFIVNEEETQNRMNIMKQRLNLLFSRSKSD